VALKIFFILLVFLFKSVSSCLMAVDPVMPVTRYKVKVWNRENGLPSNTVYAIRQTRDGYLWIGTQNGLVRFDGVRFQLYNRTRTPRLESDVIRSLYEDPKGTLWIGTDSGGLTSFKEGKFITYPVKKYPALNKIRAINRDRWGNLWIGSFSSGLTCFSNGRFTTYTIKDGLPHNQVRSICSDANEELRAVTTEGIIKLLKPGRFERIAPKTLLPYLQTTCLYREREGELWVGTGAKGLFRLEKSSVTAYGIKEGLAHLTITSLYEDRMKSIWIGTDGGGLTRISNGTLGTFSKSSGLVNCSVLSIYEDREGSLWIGTLDRGLHQLRDSIFTTYTTKEGLIYNDTRCIYEDRTGDILIGTTGGLSRLSNGVFTSRLTTKEGLLNNDVSCLFEDPTGTLWIGTWGGLHKLKNGKLMLVTQKHGLSDNRLTCILGDKQGNTWVGTANGLNRFDSHTGAITRFTTNEGLSGNHIEFLYENREGNLMIGTGTDLNHLKAGTITVYTPTGLAINRFLCAYEDNEGVSWIGTDNGLVRIKAGETFRYTVGSGLVENLVYAILEDSSGYLWLGGRSGISRISRQELEAVAMNRASQVSPDLFDEKDGMESGWCTGPGYKTRDGRLWFTTVAGVASIDPNRVKKNTPSPPIIEKFIVDGESVNIKSDAGEYKKGEPRGEPRVHPAFSNGILELAPGKKRLEFYYTAVSFISPLKITFKVKLEGFDSDWVDMKNLRSTTYTGLHPGKYTFRVTTGNTANAGETNEASFSFYMQPYFYQTTWFYVLVVLFVLMTVFSLHGYRLRQLRARKEELQKMVEARTLQLAEQAEKLKELDKAKSRFFANISHEFRTPLSLIIWPVEQILEENPDKNLETMANMILSNSRRLLNLVDQLLELAKFDSGKMKLQAARQNIVPLVKNIVMCFESLALQNKMELTFQPEADRISLFFDPEKIERIITNLLSNAFNYTPPGGKITVSIRKTLGTANPCDCVEIAVCDTGIGIPSDQRPHIFDRFYQGETIHEYKRKGTGIGLALVKELVELHHGEIEVHSPCRQDHNRGTEFILRLPMGKAHLQPGEIVNEAEDIKIAPYIDRDYHSPLAKTFDDLENDIRMTKESEPEPGAAGTARKDIILVVEDDEDMRCYIRIALGSHFNVVEAENGKEGIDKAGEIIPDLVISDVMMPELDGYELCAHLKTDIKTSHIPVILLTAKASEQSMAEGLETGADDYITKPFNIDLLVIRVRNLIRLRRQLQQKIQQDMMLQPDEVSVSSRDTEFINEIKAIMEKNLSDPGFNVEQMAKKLFMSPKTLRRKLEALTGESPNRLIRSYRLTRAVQLLKANFGNVTEVAFAVGFSSTAYFTKCFKEKFHRLPHTFQESGSGKG
jgi:signal transduction histidine kinase/ligand-binding sensor domain-containing protein/DNA-binding response OmpR family regulator